MEDGQGIPCVIYAAKSTEDLRGSIPEQLRECREMVEADPRRSVVAEYKDEAFSAYRRDRGPGLRDATQHAEDLAAEYGVAELWAQHSDRIARGDGRMARHTVEVALWALKNDVRVRTLQDPGTFHDLLYAVVTGQRNNEDSKRKAISSQAGRKRAIARGEYVGHLPDGYRLISWLDAHGKLCKRLEFDPDRRPLFELIFRLALRGSNCGQIAKTVNNRGWLTKPVRRIDRPRPFDVGKIYDLLRNPRYAALSVYRGEVLARGHWPAYISERQHERIGQLLASARDGHSRGPLDVYLLARLAHCGRCGHPLRVHTGRPRRDGARPRSYVCSSHRALRGQAQCAAAPMDAHVAEAIVIASLPALLDRDPGDLDTSPWPAEGDSSRAGPYAELVRQTAVSQRRARELADAERLREWVELESDRRTDTTKGRTATLNRLLRSWFARLSIRVDPQTVTIEATRRHAVQPAEPIVVLVDRAAWVRAAPAGHRQMRRANHWEPAEVVGALQGWADEHGRSPRQVEWKLASRSHPSSLTVRRLFRDWNRALRRAGLERVPPPVRHPWGDEEIINALQGWQRRHGRAPSHIEWASSAVDRPCAQTVCAHFGNWVRALDVAGLDPPPRPPGRRTPWPRERIIQALRESNDENGHPPAGLHWIKATAKHPTVGTVRKRFGSWGKALAAANVDGAAAISRRGCARRQAQDADASSLSENAANTEQNCSRG